MTWEPADEILAAYDILDGGDKIEIADHPKRNWRLIAEFTSKSRHH
jgi:hypothetical protein